MCGLPSDWLWKGISRYSRNAETPTHAWPESAYMWGVWQGICGVEQTEEASIGTYGGETVPVYVRGESCINASMLEQQFPAFIIPFVCV